jgi:hypothetical protein
MISAESLFTLIDLCDLTPDAAIAGMVNTARQMTAAAVDRTAADAAGSVGAPGAA